MDSLSLHSHMQLNSNTSFNISMLSKDAGIGVERFYKPHFRPSPYCRASTNTQAAASTVTRSLKNVSLFQYNNITNIQHETLSSSIKDACNYSRCSQRDASVRGTKTNARKTLNDGTPLSVCNRSKIKKRHVAKNRENSRSKYECLMKEKVIEKLNVSRHSTSTSPPPRFSSVSSLVDAGVQTNDAATEELFAKFEAMTAAFCEQQTIQMARFFDEMNANMHAALTQCTSALGRSVCESSGIDENIVEVSVKQM